MSKQYQYAETFVDESPEAPSFDETPEDVVLEVPKYDVQEEQAAHAHHLSSSYSFEGLSFLFSVVLILSLICVLNGTFPPVFLCISIPLYLVESLVNRTFKSLFSRKSTSSVLNTLQKLQNTAPQISFSVRCYHTETNSIEEHYTDAEGNSGTRMTTETVDVQTFKETEEFLFQEWTDSSSDISALLPFDIVLVKLNSKVDFGDQQTREAFEHQKKCLENRNRHRDDKMDISVDMKVPGFRKQLLAVHNCANPPWFLSLPVYFLSVITLTNWPFRCFVLSKCAKVNFQLVKYVFKHSKPALAPLWSPAY